MTEDHSIRLHITNKKWGLWQITDPAAERPVLYLTEPGIHIQGEAGHYMAATFQVLPSLDITVVAELQYACQHCWMPLEQAAITRNVRIASEGVAALFSSLTFTDVESDQPLLFVAACEISLDHGPKATALLTCIETDPHQTRCSHDVPDGVCQRCARPLKDPHHKNCCCLPCRKRKLREQEAFLEDL